MTARDKRIIIGLVVSVIFISAIALSQGGEAAFFTLIGMGALASVASFMEGRVL